MSGEQCLLFRLQITKIASKVKPLKIKRRLCVVPKWYSMLYVGEIYLTAQRFSLLCFWPYTEEIWLWVRYVWQEATDRENKLWDTVQSPCRMSCTYIPYILSADNRWMESGFWALNWAVIILYSDMKSSLKRGIVSPEGAFMGIWMRTGVAACCFQCSITNCLVQEGEWERWTEVPWLHHTNQQSQVCLRGYPKILSVEGRAT